MGVCAGEHAKHYAKQHMPTARVFFYTEMQQQMSSCPKSRTMLHIMEVREIPQEGNNFGIRIKKV